MNITKKQWSDLEKAARAVSKKSYSPYSKFKVGSAVLTEKGIFVGTNVENASFGLTICAERAATFNAISNGAKKILAVLIFTPTKKATPPCGACRQVIAEFASKCIVRSVSKTLAVYEERLDALLPGAFKL